jgi:DNA-binding MarR family transcriptional regulator
LDGEHALSAGAREFIEAVGLFFEQLGIPRIGGRILGLLMLAERPLTLDDMAGLLLVSRASVSTNARMSVAGGLVEHVSLPGDRRDYYRFRAEAWEQRLRFLIAESIAFRRLLERGLAALGPEDAVGRARLEEGREFYTFVEQEMGTLIERWHARSAGGESAPPAPAVRS